VAALSTARRVVVKIGSALLVDREDGALREGWLAALVADVARLRAGGAEVVLVSSGSIALGRGLLDLPESALTLEQSQAAAAVGQIRLASAYEAALAAHGIKAAQVLVTLEDSEDRRRYLNSRATLDQLLRLGAVPIVNENDTVATDEIRYGDNDRLAAQVAVTAGADLLVLLSDVDGLYTANPQSDPQARHIAEVPEITPEIMAMAGDAGSGLSRGGMRTKVMAARTATAGGCALAITRGDLDHPLAALEAGGRATWFAAQGTPQQKRKAWIAAMKPRGRITVDAGAARALGTGSSLLPAGVSGVSGAFGRGDPVELMGPEGRVLGQGLTRYDRADAERIRGLRLEQVEAALGHPARGPLVHRDDLAF